MCYLLATSNQGLVGGYSSHTAITGSKDCAANRHFIQNFCCAALFKPCAGMPEYNRTTLLLCSGRLQGLMFLC
jgi:hypothetical protein